MFGSRSKSLGHEFTMESSTTVGEQRATNILPPLNILSPCVGSKAASAAVLGDEAFTLRLPDKLSIFTAEMYALLISFQQLEKSTKKHFIIFSDSKSALQAIQSKD